jgi:hypothetical protein
VVTLFNTVEKLRPISHLETVRNPRIAEEIKEAFQYYPVIRALAIILASHRKLSIFDLLSDSFASRRMSSDCDGTSPARFPRECQFLDEVLFCTILQISTVFARMFQFHSRLRRFLSMDDVLSSKS